MAKSSLLYISIFLNVLLLSAFLALSYFYKEKIVQKFVKIKGEPAIVMFGNSITAQGNWTRLLNRTDVLNSGMPGLCTYHFLSLLKTEITDYKPKICFVMAGINDITVGVEPEKIRKNYQTILETIVAHDIIPVVTLTLHERNDPLSKKEVEKLNTFLVKYCRENNIDYLDLNQFVSDSTGLKPEFAVDKTHLNEKAYQIWSREIKQILAEKGI